MNLLKATLISIVVAVVVLFTLVLPAEYDLDPLGTGALLGLTGLSRSGPEALVDQAGPYRQEQRVFELSPFESVEYKYRMEQGAAMLYRWRADGELLSEMHSEPDGAAPGYAETFAKSRAQSGQGNYTAPFPGIHGWFWQNRGTQDVTVVLTVQGYVDGAFEFRDGQTFEYTLEDQP